MATTDETAGGVMPQKVRVILDAALNHPDVVAFEALPSKDDLTPEEEALGERAEAALVQACWDALAELRATERGRQ